PPRGVPGDREDRHRGSGGQAVDFVVREFRARRRSAVRGDRQRRSGRSWGGDVGPGRPGRVRASAGGHTMSATLTSRRLPEVTRRFDVWILACAVTLSVIGIAMVYSTTWGRLVRDGDPGGYFAIRQTLFVVLGALAAWVVYRLDRPALMALAAVGYAGSVLGLLAVLTPLGTTINGTRAWLTLPGGFTLQPAEFAKVFVVLLAALWLSDRRGMR